MASTLFIQVPPKAVANEHSEWREAAVPFCLASSERHLQQHGRQNLQDLSALAKSANSLVLLLASADVATFVVEVPPMSPQKLKAALPNLLEDRVLEDPASLLFCSTQVIDGRCTVVAVERDWMETLYAWVNVLETRKLSAFPMAMGLPYVADKAVVMLEPAWINSSGISVSIKSGSSEIIGLTLQTPAERPETLDLIDAINSVSLFSGVMPLHLILDSHLLQAYEAIDEAGRLRLNIAQVQNADWAAKIAGDFPASLNLLSELVEENSVSFDWLKWRWTLGLAASVLLVSLFGLNWEAFQLKSEANALNASLRTTYQQLFPNEPSLRDPLLQLQQKINQSKKLAGQSTEEDFLVLSGQLALAWQTAHPQQTTGALASLEYRERALIFKPKNSSEVQLDALRAALRDHGLKIELKDGSYKVARNDGGSR